MTDNSGNEIIDDETIDNAINDLLKSVEKLGWIDNVANEMSLTRLWRKIRPILSSFAMWGLLIFGMFWGLILAYLSAVDTGQFLSSDFMNYSSVVFAIPYGLWMVAVAWVTKTLKKSDAETDLDFSDDRPKKTILREKLNWVFYVCIWLSIILNVALRLIA